MIETQSTKFKDAAREAECDEDEARWTERMTSVTGQKPITDQDIRDKAFALLEKSKGVLRENGMSEAEIEARVAARGKTRASKLGKSK